MAVETGILIVSVEKLWVTSVQWIDCCIELFLQQMAVHLYSTASEKCRTNMVDDT